MAVLVLWPRSSLLGLGWPKTDNRPAGYPERIVWREFLLAWEICTRVPRLALLARAANVLSPEDLTTLVSWHLACRGLPSGRTPGSAACWSQYVWRAWFLGRAGLRGGHSPRSQGLEFAPCGGRKNPDRLFPTGSRDRSPPKYQCLWRLSRPCLPNRPCLIPISRA